MAWDMGIGVAGSLLFSMAGALAWHKQKDRQEKEGRTGDVVHSLCLQPGNILNTLLAA